MRIILGLETCTGCKFFIASDCKAPSYPCHMNRPIEVTDAEWATIYRGFPKWYEQVGNRYRKHFADYLRDLISLTGEGAK